MEVLYKKLYGFRKTVIEYWVIYLISVVILPRRKGGDKWRTDVLAEDD